MQSDIWSLGVILLENIAQIHPFKGSSHAETLMNIRNGRLNSITPIPKDVGDLIMKMISVVCNNTNYFLLIISIFHIYYFLILS